MSRILEYVAQAYEGLLQYLSHNNLVVILSAVLLFFWLAEKKETNEKTGRLLFYTLLMVIILVCPLSAMAVMLYQTAFYDYTWAWSLVPLTIVIAYGVVVFWEKETNLIRKMGIIGLTVVILCLTGNQGMIQKVSTREAEGRSETKQILQEIVAFNVQKDCVVWAPRTVMQEIRRYDGRIMLVYGKDMWDEKSGAYDYEAYNQEITDAYTWLEKAIEYSNLAESMEKPEEAIGHLDELYKWSDNAEHSMEQIVEAGANTIVLPSIMSEYLNDTIMSIIQEKGKSLQKAYTQEYTIYVMN